MPLREEAPKQGKSDAYCPHCQLLMEKRTGEGWPRRPTRCPHCSLMVGSGRARTAPSGEPGARGTAAGIFAQRAKRAAADSRASTREIANAIRAVATDLGIRPQRLLMVDYEQRAAKDGNLPPLRDVLAAYGSWKRARLAATTRV